MHKSARAVAWGMLAAGILAGAFVSSAAIPPAVQAQPPEEATFSGPALELEGQAVLAPLYKGGEQPFGPYLPGVDLRITNRSRPQNETTIAGDKYNPLQVIGGFNDYDVILTGFGGNGVAYSTDGGTTFTHLGPFPGGGVPLTAGFNNAGGDPAIDFDSRGRAFYSHLGIGTGGTSNFTRNNGIFCATSLTGGATWSPTVGVAVNVYPGTGTVPFEDKPYVGVDDYLGSPFRDRAYVSWTRFYPGAHPNGGTGGGDIWVARSLDNGATWTPVRITTLANEPLNTGTGTVGSTFVQFSVPVVAPNGDVFVAYWFGGRLNCQRSTDGGVTFGPATQPFGPVFGSASIPSPLPNQSYRAPNTLSAHCDPTRPGNVYVVCADDDDTPSATDAANIFFARSTDSGATWQPRVKLNDDGLNRNQHWPWMAVNDRGDIEVIWYDTRNDAGNHLLDVYETSSSDGGVTWAANTRVTDANFEPNTAQFGGNGFFGDYNGLGTAGNRFHALWCDTRTGGAPEQEIYYDRKACPSGVSVSCPPDQGTDHRSDLTLRFCFTNTGGCTEDFVYQLTDPKGWVIASSAALSGTVSVAPGASFCLDVTVHTPINCTAGEVNQMCWSAYPASSPSLVQRCCTNVECTSPTATVISSFTGRAGVDFAELEYTLPDEEGLEGVNVYRTEGLAADYARITASPIPVDGRGTYRYVDRSVKIATTYSYQLGLIEKGGREVRVGQVSVRTVRAEFALSRPSPNPTSGGFVLTAAMARDGAARLRIFDVNGRVVGVLHDGFLSAGEHVFSWDGQVAGRPAESGVYFVTYEAAGQKLTQRVSIMK